MFNTLMAATWLFTLCTLLASQMASAQSFPKRITYKILVAETSVRSLALPAPVLECAKDARVEIDTIYDRLTFSIEPDYICLYKKGHPEMSGIQFVLPVVSTSTPITGGINIYAEKDPLLDDGQRLAIAVFDPLGSDSDVKYPGAPVSIYFFEEYPAPPRGPLASLSMFYATGTSSLTDTRR